MAQGRESGSGAEEVAMATTSVVAVDARCPLCGNPILSFGLGGRVTAEDLHAVPLHRWGGSGEGYMICDECGVLANLPQDLTVN